MTRNSFKSLTIVITAYTEPTVWIIKKNTKSIIDLGCGFGQMMLIIKQRYHPELSVGVDIFKPYIQRAKAAKTHDKYINSDIRKLNIPPKSFDVVLLSHVIEHLPYRDFEKTMSMIEVVAKQQVVIATPLGEMPNDTADGNKYNKHISAYYPEDFTKRGYKTIKWGRKELDNAIYSTNSITKARILKLIAILISPMYLVLPNFGNFYIYAWKEIK